MEPDVEKVITDARLDGAASVVERHVSGCRCTIAQRMVGDGCEACNPELAREIERENFEDDAGQYGFDMTRHDSAAPEPWSEYASEATGHRWAGWLAAKGMA